MLYRHCRPNAVAGAVAELGYQAEYNLMLEGSTLTEANGRPFGTCELMAAVECSATMLLNPTGGHLVGTTGVDSCASLCDESVAAVNYDNGSTTTLISIEVLINCFRAMKITTQFAHKSNSRTFV
jgi:hypothetical protein